jgi:hypothetical protein
VKRRLVVCTVLALAGTPLSAQTVAGRLLTTGTKEPIVLGVVLLLDSGMIERDRTYTDERGRFQLESTRAGSYYVAASAPGHTSRMDGVLDLPAGARISVDFYLKSNVMQLADSIVVRADRQRIVPHLDAQGFYERQKMGFGHFITPDQLARRPVFDATDLLRSIPGVRVLEDPLRGSSVRMRGDTAMFCVPTLYVNGMTVMSIAGEAVLSDFVAIDDIEAMEIYPRSAGVPLQYAGRGRCGVILIWTKTGAR